MTVLGHFIFPWKCLGTVIYTLLLPLEESRKQSKKKDQKKDKKRKTDQKTDQKTDKKTALFRANKHLEKFIISNCRIV